ncbi:MAG TPA: vWA domain-containing protein [Planctomycetota bacterium]|nr:vWA domain-containing protein [Planctomycetota bacterium]
MRQVLLAILLMVGLCAGACADELILKDGRKFTGEVLRLTPGTVHIRTVGGILVFDRDEVARIIEKEDPKKIYRQKLAALKDKAVVDRLELARWCLAHELEDEARLQLEQLLLDDPDNADAQALLTELTRRTGSGLPLRTEVVLTDGSEVKGQIVNPLFTLDSPYGVLHIPSRSIVSIDVGEGRKADVVETAQFKVRGTLSEELFVIDSKLGRLTIAKKDVRAISFYKPTPEELADYEFKTAMKRLDQLGLDVILVIDTTDSMVGILHRLRDQSADFCRVIRKFVPNSQFGLVAFRDDKKHDPGLIEYVTRMTPLTSDVELFRLKLAELRAAGGGDVPEAVFEGLAMAMTQGGWRPRSHRVIILIGDAPPHDEDKGIAKTYQLVRDWHKNTLGVLHTVDTTGFDRLMAEFRTMARDGGGQALIVNNEKTIARDLIPLILGVQWRDRFFKTFDEDKPDAATPATDATTPPDTGVIVR